MGSYQNNQPNQEDKRKYASNDRLLSPTPAI